MMERSVVPHSVYEVIGAWGDEGEMKEGKEGREGKARAGFGRFRDWVVALGPRTQAATWPGHERANKQTDGKIERARDEDTTR